MNRRKQEESHRGWHADTRAECSFTALYRSKHGEPVMSTGAAEEWMTGALVTSLARALHRWPPC
eukprot:scaffold36788_cov90-Phaeocystis_antarctica.AAC.1